MTDDRVTELLQRLAKYARDCENGYRTAAEDVRNADLKAEFRQMSRERGEVGDELDRLIRQRGGEPAPRGGSTLGAMHRTFIDLKSAVTGGAREAILTEVARGEAAVEASYDAALREALPASVRSVIERQHIRTREIRDRYRAMSGYRGPVSERIKRAAPKTAAQAGQLVRQRPMLTSMTAFFFGLVIGLTISSTMMGEHRQSY